MRKEINRKSFLASPRDIKAIATDEVGVVGGCHDNILNTMYEIQQLQREIEKTTEGLRKVDEILERISQDQECKYYGLVLKMWYIDRVPKEQIAEEIGYGRATIYEIRKRAIRKLAVNLFGLGALDIV